MSAAARGRCCVLAAPLVWFTLEQRQCQSTRERPSIRRTCQTRCIGQQCAGELLLIQSININHLDKTRMVQKYTTYFEIRVRRHPPPQPAPSTAPAADNHP